MAVELVIDAEVSKTADYSYLLDDPGIEVISARFRMLLEEAVLVLEELGLTSNTCINERILAHCVLDYFADIKRLKAFHHIDYTNLAKIYGYVTYWFVRLKPIQLIAEVDDHYLPINEIVALNIFFPKVLENAGVDACALTEECQNELRDLFNLFRYNLIYRLSTPQSLELAIQALCSGIRISKTD